MFDLGWTELLVIGVVALIVVGPKDLPGMFRTLGKFTAKIKGMAREFQRAMDDAADEAGVKDIAGDMKKMTSAKSLGLDAVKKATSGMTGWPEGRETASDATGKKGPEAQKLSDERAASAEKYKASTAKAATERKAREAKAAKAALKKSSEDAATDAPAGKKPAVKKTAAKKPAAKKPAAKAAAAKPAAKKPAAKATTKPAASAATKSAPKPAPKSPAKKPAARKTAAKKPAAKSGDTA